MMLVIISKKNDIKAVSEVIFRIFIISISPFRIIDSNYIRNRIYEVLSCVNHIDAGIGGVKLTFRKEENNKLSILFTVCSNINR